MLLVDARAELAAHVFVHGRSKHVGGDIIGGAVLLYDWSKSPLGNMDFYVLG